MTDNRHSSPPNIYATGAILLGAIISWALSQGETASVMAHQYAVIFGVSLAIGIALEYRGDIVNVIRSDIMALVSLYFLTLAEFVANQGILDNLIEPNELQPALTACALGFSAIAITRHYSPPLPASLLKLTRIDPPHSVILGLLSFCFIGGFFYMLTAVNYDVGAMIQYFMAPRFHQPWQRGRFGDWRALLFEFSMLLYLVPPICGVVLANRKEYTQIAIAYTLFCLLFTLFYGFTSGTRNIFATFLATFLVGYIFAAKRNRRKEISTILLLSGIAMVLATNMMLEFRQIGFSRYFHGGQEEDQAEESSFKFLVDNNLLVIARLIQVFPDRHEYLGFEIPYLAIIRPIPRAMWKNKPEGMSTSIEQALGATGGTYTLAASFIGEAYMSGGWIGVIFFGGALGIFLSWWNRLGHSDNSSFGQLLYASGFFAAVISMRSVLVFTTAILPTLTAMVFGQWIIQTELDRRHRKKAQKEAQQ